VAESKKVPSRTTALPAPSPADFDDVLRLIDAARGRAVAAVNKELIELYWNIGEHISRKIAAGSWGDGTVEALAAYIRQRQPTARGFSARNLWRMMQFFETHRGQPKLAALLRELSCSHHLVIPSRKQARRGTGVLPGHGDPQALVVPRAAAATERCPVRADGPGAAKTVNTADRIAPRSRNRPGHGRGRRHDSLPPADEAPERVLPTMPSLHHRFSQFSRAESRHSVVAPKSWGTRRAWKCPRRRG
jgi:DUF1016 N-terminal domain